MENLNLAASVAYDTTQARQAAENIFITLQVKADVIRSLCSKIETFELQTGNAPMDVYTVDDWLLKIDKELGALYREAHKEIGIYFDERALYLQKFIKARQIISDSEQKNSAE